MTPFTIYAGCGVRADGEPEKWTSSEPDARWAEWNECLLLVRRLYVEYSRERFHAKATAVMAVIERLLRLHPDWSPCLREEP
jgi:hypothetical protein